MSKGFLGAATAAFLRRRVQRQRMHLAALRALREATSQTDERLWVDFAADDGDLLGHAAPWLSSYAADIASMRRPRRLAALPSLSVVLLVVGTRGDVQPFVQIGRALARRHRVRLATHTEFRSVVEDAGLEFYPLAGDPHELVEYMIKTGGRLVPTRLDAIVSDVPKQRAVIGEILESTWRACTEPDPGHGDARPFAAQWIIANPPSYGHIHCAEALNVPLHMVFTMPWTATSAFPHPLTRLEPGEHRPVRNFLSYSVVNAMMWAGLGDVINGFRESTLHLDKLDLAQGASLIEDLEVPFTYLFPESVVPRPPDWGPHIDLTNFVFAEEPHYEPPDDLAAFLAAGPPPIYVGFGSCVVPDPAKLTHTVFEALEKAGARGVVCRGWGDLGQEEPPPHVLVIKEVPHDWLFPRCRIVCHHGGAGTTAAGLRVGLPSVIVPFFGDQFFWGRVVSDAGAGPPSIPVQELTSEKLAEAFAACGSPEMRKRARAVGAKIRRRDGVELVLRSFHGHLPLVVMRCARDPGHAATRYCERCRLRLCDACQQTYHADHRTHPYRYVDWSLRPVRTVSGELREFVADAAHSLRAALSELLPARSPGRRGVVLGVRKAGAGRAPRGTIWKTPGSSTIPPMR